MGVKPQAPTMKNHLTPYAQSLRSNLTDAEQKIWHQLRGKQIHQYKFRRQHIIGKYIVDFLCADLKLIIEIDGGQHNEDADKIRTEFLEGEGYKVLRFWNNDVLGNIDGVMEVISIEIQSLTPT